MAVKKQEKQTAGINCMQIATVSYPLQQHLSQDLEALITWEGA